MPKCRLYALVSALSPHKLQYSCSTYIFTYYNETIYILTYYKTLTIITVST